MNDEDDTATNLATQGSITFAGNFLGKVLGFAFVAVATRLVSPTEYGAFTLGLSIVLFVQGFASLSLYRSIDYFVPKFLDGSEYGKAKTTIRNVLAIGVICSSVGGIVVLTFQEYIYMAFGGSKLPEVLPYMILIIPLQTVFRSLIASYNGIKSMAHRVVMKDILNPLMRTLGAILFVSSGAGLVGLVGGYLTGLLVAITFGVASLIYNVDWIRNASATQISNRSLFSYSLPLILAGIIYSLVGQVDYFVIGYFLDSTEVGYYRVAYLLAANLLIVLNAVTPIFKPMVAENENDSLLESQYQLSTRWITMLTLPIAVVLVLQPDTYLSLFFTAEYSVASAAVVVLTIGYLINASFGPEGMMLEGLGHTRITLVNTFILIGVNTTLDFLLVPRFGIVGAAVATGTAFTVAGFAGVVEIYLLKSITAFNKDLVRAWVSFLPALLTGYLVSKFQMQALVMSLSLPTVVLLTYILTLRQTSSFSIKDQKVATKLDSYIGISIFSRIIKGN